MEDAVLEPLSLAVPGVEASGPPSRTADSSRSEQRPSRRTTPAGAVGTAAAASAVASSEAAAAPARPAAGRHGRNRSAATTPTDGSRSGSDATLSIAVAEAQPPSPPAPQFGRRANRASDLNASLDTLSQFASTNAGRLESHVYLVAP